MPVKTLLFPMKKTKKCPKSAREKQKVGVKKVKTWPKSGRENSFCPWKNRKKSPKKLFTEKTTLPLSQPILFPSVIYITEDPITDWRNSLEICIRQLRKSKINIPFYGPNFTTRTKIADLYLVFFLPLAIFFIMVAPKSLFFCTIDFKL